MIDAATSSTDAQASEEADIAMETSQPEDAEAEDTPVKPRRGGNKQPKSETGFGKRCGEVQLVGFFPLELKVIFKGPVATI